MHNYQTPRFGFTPKHLSNKHRNNPELALEAFCEDDNLQGHLSRLKEWRDCVIGDYYWKGTKNSPAELFYFYELNLSLVEALFMFKLAENRTEGYINGKLPIEQSAELIREERSKWLDFPNSFTIEELTDPYIVLKEIFTAYSVDEYCTMLNEWMGHGLSSHRAKEFVSANELIGTYDNLLKMYTIAFLFYRRKADNPALDPLIDESKLNFNSNNLSTEIRKVESNPTPTEKLILSEIQDLMLRRVPQIQLMDHLGTHLATSTYFILFLVEDDSLSPDSNLCNKIEDQCRYIANVQAFVHKVAVAKIALDERRRFWINSFQKGTIFYKNPMVHIPSYDDIIKINEEEAIKIWNRWGEQGKSFFEGA